MNAKERIEILLQYLNMGPKTLAEQTGLKDSRIMDIKRGRVQSVAYPVAEAISGTFHQVSKEWLLTGEGNMIADSSEDENIKLIVTPADATLELMRQELSLMRESHNNICKELSLMREEMQILRKHISTYQPTEHFTIGLASDHEPPGTQT